MSIEVSRKQSWYLAQHIADSGQRQRLFAWLSEQNVTPWTPLETRFYSRSDRQRARQRRVCQVFPGYLFLLADLSTQSVSSLRRHSAFLDFVSFGNGPCPVSDAVVSGLMSLYPDDAPGTETPTQTPLTTAQYQHLLNLDVQPHPVTRIAMLLDLVRRR